MTSYRRKLIEVALPLEAINIASVEEKSVPRHGHPQTIHLWWARRPLAACRGVLWSSLVDDPSEYMPDDVSANTERERLFKILGDLVLWENVNNEEVLDKARLEIACSVARDLGVDVPVGKEAIRDFLATKAPPVLDPFAGGGSIPLEAQRLGLRAYASDLNPVAVLINKALIEIPPNFTGMPPVHPPENEQEKQGSLFKKQWRGAEGLAEDVHYYGKWMRDKAEKRIGHLYPKVKITADILAEYPDLKAQGLKLGDELNVIAWLWARTVRCPNPACQVHAPLVRSFILSSKKRREVRIAFDIEKTNVVPLIKFSIQTDWGTTHPGTVNRGGATCIACGTPIPFEYIREKGKSRELGTRLIAMFATGGSKRVFLPPIDSQENSLPSSLPSQLPDCPLPEQALGYRVQQYGFKSYTDLFTNRQLFAITSFCEILQELKQVLRKDLEKVNISKDDQELYIKAISTYLSCAISRLASYNNSFCTWNIKGGSIAQIFTRQSIAMNWDYIETNPLREISGNWIGGVEWVADVLRDWIIGPSPKVTQDDATRLDTPYELPPVIVTDPPYYDNIGYGDLSDFFYIWLRKCISKEYPDLFSTILVPKTSELIATPFRFDGDRKKAESFFESGLLRVFRNFYSIASVEYPIAIFYAFKQAENESEDRDSETESFQETTQASTGWETMLSGLTGSGFEIVGTWPIRTERNARMVARGTNALASSIILICRPRPYDIGSLTRREFLASLKKELPPALRQLQLGSIAPVDLAQAAIGPGMAIFSRYSAVLESDGSPMRVRTALTLINHALDEYLTEQEGEYDGDTRWALAWYEQYGHNEAPYGIAETLSKAKNTSVQGLVEAGILEARGGKVHLLHREELDTDWDPEKDKRLTAWESVQHLIFALDRNGEEAAAALLGHLGGLSETARDLAYRLYTVCERKGWAQDALMYNMLVVAWPRLKELSANIVKQGKLL